LQLKPYFIFGNFFGSFFNRLFIFTCFLLFNWFFFLFYCSFFTFVLFDTKNKIVGENKIARLLVLPSLAREHLNYGVIVGRQALRGLLERRSSRPDVLDPVYLLFTHLVLPGLEIHFSSDRVSPARFVQIQTRMFLEGCNQHVYRIFRSSA
jgi:hypothetical protein